MRIGILILNWNGIELLKRFLPVVVQHSEGHAIYVVDNASTDESISWVKNNFPQVKLIQLPENKGYAGGYNAALAQVDEELVCLLNSDVQITAGWCDPMINAFENNNRLAAAQPKILDLNNPEFFEYAGACGGYLDSLGYAYCRGRIFEELEEDRGQYDDVADVDWASGAALFLRVKAFEEVGGFDESYFAHQEEIDLCWRLQMAGYELKCIPDSNVYHLGGGTLAMQSPKKAYLNFRNSLYSIVKNESRNNWVATLFIRMVLDGVAGIRFCLKGEWNKLFMILKAHRSLYSEMQLLIKKRSANQSKRKKVLDRKVASIVIAHFIRGKNYFSDL